MRDNPHVMVASGGHLHCTLVVFAMKERKYMKKETEDGRVVRLLGERHGERNEKGEGKWVGGPNCKGEPYMAH